MMVVPAHKYLPSVARIGSGQRKHYSEADYYDVIDCEDLEDPRAITIIVKSENTQEIDTPYMRPLTVDWQEVITSEWCQSDTIEKLFSRMASHQIEKPTLWIPERVLMDAELKETFQRLAGKWREETGHLSSPVQKAMHPAYQQIIGMGRPVLSLIFRELKERGGHWYWALAAITRVNPVPSEFAGNIKKMKEIWLKYAEENDLV